MQLHLQHQNESQYAAALIGEFDAMGCHEIRQELEVLVEEHGDKAIEFDIGQVTFMDSSGIGAIVFMLKRMRAKGGSLTLVNAQGQPKQLISLLRVDQALPVKAANDTP